MVQIDPLLAYGFASTLAVAAEKSALTSPQLKDRPLIWTLLWLSLAFAPQAVFLLWRYPAWETMFVFAGDEQVPAWLAAGTPIAIVALGYAGFVATKRLRQVGRRGVAHLLMALSFLLSVLIATVGWDGTGLQRMLYPGSGAQWLQATPMSLGDLLRSGLVLDLLWLEAILMVPFVVMLVRWFKPSLRLPRSLPISEVQS